MSDVNFDESAARLLKSIVKSKPAVVAAGPVVKSEPKVPQKAPEQQPETQEAIFQRRYSDELDAIVEMERHPDLFDESAAGMENVKRVVDWVTQRGWYVSRANVSEAIRALKGELTPLRQPTPLSQPKPAPAPAPPAPVAPPPQEPVDDLPELPAYCWRVLGNNQLRTKKDIRAIPSNVYSHLYRGPHQAAFRARIDAIGRLKT